MLEKLLHWILFGLCLALFPIILALLLVYLRHQSIDFKTLVSHGELYIMITSFIAPLFGEWLGIEIKNKLYRIFRLLLMGGFVYLLLFSVAFYTALITDNASYDVNRVFANSTRMLIGCVITILASIVLKERLKNLEGVKNKDDR